MIDPDFIEIMTTDFWEESDGDFSGLMIEMPDSSHVAIKIQDGEDVAGALLNATKLDALIRSLAAARVEISKEPPK